MHHLTNWQAHLASLNLLRSPLADESRKALRAMAAERGIVLNVSRGEWSYSTPSENGYQKIGVDLPKRKSRVNCGIGFDWRAG